MWKLISAILIKKGMPMVGFLTRDILRAKTSPYRRVGYQTNIPPTTCTSDKGKQINKQAEAAHVEAWMQGVVWSCITCGVRYAMHQSMWKSFGDALEMCQKSAEFNTQGHTLTSPPF